MELTVVKNPQVKQQEEFTEFELLSTSKAFIEANTIESNLNEIRAGHIIPVFIKDNEPVISQAEFIQSALDMVADVYHGETILKPNVRLSHPIKGRIPEAKLKPANQLLEHEKTLYYERMAFVVEVPSIFSEINGNRINLTIGGVKAYNLDNLYNKSGADQHFKIFVGFQNKVCTNLCVSTDGLLSSLKVKNLDNLRNAIRMLLQDFDALQFATNLKELHNYQLTEPQFAQLIGRCRMYKYLPELQQADIPQLMFGESQLNTVCNDYFRDKAFCRSDDGTINLWNLYNLFTGSNKSSYIDTFLDRGVNAYDLAITLKEALDNRQGCWFLN